jgi:endonuclease/exonuclease/phosphatase family metal-dependent hydrolase
MKKFIKVILAILAILLLTLGGIILYATLTDYQPEKESILARIDEAKVLPDTSVISLLIWNIGYAGLDANMDFFYDGGEKVRPTEEASVTNLEAIMKFLEAQDTVDFILLQEVDIRSKRSYRVNQVDSINALFPLHTSTFGKNYDVFFVPVPPISPMGKVNSGILSLSKHQPAFSACYAFPGEFAWPTRLFMLDRCFLVNRHPLSNGKELVLINTHNSAYDTDGSMKRQEMEYLRAFLLEERIKGNHVIAGGDWNQCPPGFEPGYPNHDRVDLSYIDPGFPEEGWSWLHDPSVPTNRRVQEVWDRKSTPRTTIDFFLLSPGVIPLDVRTIDLDFEHSDHHPVIARVKLVP